MLVAWGRSPARIRSATCREVPPVQSCESTVHSTGTRPALRMPRRAASSRAPYGGRIRGVGWVPARRSAPAVARRVASTWAADCVLMSACAQLWLATRKPERSTLRAMAGAAATRCPTMKKVAGTFALRRIRSSRPVGSAGPSSNVSDTRPVRHEPPAGWALAGGASTASPVVTSTAAANSPVNGRGDRGMGAAWGSARCMRRRIARISPVWAERSVAAAVGNREPSAPRNDASPGRLPRRLRGPPQQPRAPLEGA